MLATDGSLNVQDPPVTESVKVMLEPTHTWLAPEMAVGEAFMVTANFVTQPMPDVYITVSAPAATPSATPVPVMSALVVLLSVHAPPEIASV